MFLTVIVRVYNREDTIEECLMSLLNQTMIDDIQILIIDDCSDDNSLDIIHKLVCKYSDKHWTIVRQDKNMGRGKALNTAKQYIEGKYCCVLDSDDIYNRNTWVEELYNEIGDDEYDIIHNGIINEYHVKHIYLSSKFKICPIPNFNYYEDHYSRWFFVNNFRIYIYKIPNYYNIKYNSNDRTNNHHEKDKYKFFNYWLKLLYEDVFYYRDEKDDTDLINRINNFNYHILDEVLMESYNEIKNEMIKNYI